MPIEPRVASPGTCPVPGLAPLSSFRPPAESQRACLVKLDDAQEAFGSGVSLVKLRCLRLELDAKLCLFLHKYTGGSYRAYTYLMDSTLG